MASALRCRRGSIAVQTALVMVTLIAFAALGLDIAKLLLEERRMQAAADAAVMAANVNGRTVSQATADAIAVAGAQGFANGSNTVSVTYNSPATVGTYGLGSGEVIIQKTFAARLLALFGKSPIRIQVRAVSMQQSQSVGCLLALDTSAANAVVVRNNSAISNTGCELVANSTSSGALYVENTSNVLGPIYLVGGLIRQNNTVVTGSPIVTNATVPVVDPYATVPFPAPSGPCLSGNVNRSMALTAGHYCTGITIANNSVVTLGKGTYFIDGPFTVGRNSSITGTDSVTLLVSPAYSVTVGNNVTLRLSAPTSGDLRGLAVASTRATVKPVFTINNGVSFFIEGAFYLPGWKFTFSGQAAASGGNCTQLIAEQLDLASSLNLKTDCSASGVRPIGRVRSMLVR